MASVLPIRFVPGGNPGAPRPELTWRVARTVLPECFSFTALQPRSIFNLFLIVRRYLNSTASPPNIWTKSMGSKNHSMAGVGRAVGFLSLKEW